MRSILLLFVVFFMLACQNNKTQITDGQESKPVAAKSTSSYEGLEVIPFEQLKYLFDNCDQVDYIFNELPISMALSEKPAIQNNISFVSPDLVTNVPANCMPLGRQIFYYQAEIIIEADLYFEGPCAFLVFMENEKPKYANMLSKEGINFYNNVFSQVSNANSGQ